MGFWDSRAPDKTNIRRFEGPNVWRAYADELDHQKTVVETGCGRALESFLIEALNSTHLLILAGAGASFSAKNATGQLAPGWADLWKVVTDAAGAQFAKVIKLIPNGEAISNIEKLLTHCKLYVALYGPEDANSKLVAEFIAKAEGAIVKRVDFVSDATDLTAHELVLRKVARRGTRKPRPRVFTTNYDLCFEQAGQRQRFVVIDGFSHSSPQVYDRGHFALDIVRREGSKEAPEYAEGVFHLYKLHGSLDWRRTPSEIVRDRSSAGSPVLIYPRDSKYQEAFEPPYLDMMGSFQAALREPDTTLVVCGFGFNDDHISQPILAALESNVSFRLVVCDPAFLPDASLVEAKTKVVVGGEPANAFHQKLLRLASLDDPRLALLSGRFEDLARALPDLVAETERERQANRVRTLNETAPVAKQKA